jgi:Ni/Co efflux regulator RcnB
MFKQILIAIALVSCLGTFAFAQDQTSADKKECSKNCCSGHDSHMSMTMAHNDMDSTHSSNHQMKSNESDDFSIVREGEIDLVAIDVNGDGMVYQDQMCWNVISDESGECPQCGMTLKEVSLETAKENLVENDYEVK